MPLKYGSILNQTVNIEGKALNSCNNNSPVCRMFIKLIEISKPSLLDFSTGMQGLSSWWRVV